MNEGGIVEKKYSCRNNERCVEDSNGPFSFDQCNKRCGEVQGAPKYSCKNGRCIKEEDGDFATLANCQTTCQETGGNKNLILWIGLLVVFVIFIIALVYAQQRQKKKKKSR